MGANKMANQKQQSTKGGKKGGKGAKAQPNHPKPRSRSQPRPSPITVVGAAQRRNPPKIGMGDLINHRISYIAGYIMAGATTGSGGPGIQGQVYFSPNNQSTPQIASNQASTATYAGPAIIPVAMADSQVGQSYAADVVKHYTRKVVKDVQLSFHSVQPSTSKNCEVVVAPVRGIMGIVDTALTTLQYIGNKYDLVESMAGAVSSSSWEDFFLNMKKFIAGGSGKDQNEFNIATTFGTGGTTALNANNLQQLVPCGFAVSGLCQDSSLYGLNLFAVVVTEIVDLLDWVGGANDTSIIGAPKRPDIFASLAAEREKNAKIARLLQAQELVDRKSAERELHNLRESQTSGVAVGYAGPVTQQSPATPQSAPVPVATARPLTSYFGPSGY